MSFLLVANLATCLHCLGKECLQSVWWRAGGPGFNQIPGLLSLPGCFLTPKKY